MKHKRRNKGQRQAENVQRVVAAPLSSSRRINFQPRPVACVCACVCVCVCVCVCLTVFSISASAESEPEDPLELIEEHKGADVTLREGDEKPHTHTHIPVQLHKA